MADSSEYHRASGPLQEAQTNQHAGIGENASSTDAAENVLIPMRNILFLPFMSASFPNGTRRMAMEREIRSGDQERVTASRENSCPIAGRAILTQTHRKGVMKLLITAIKRITLCIVGVIVPFPALFSVLHHPRSS
jgi:hypothetical protein